MPKTTPKPKQEPTPLELREPLLQAMMTHIPFDGWSEKALFAAAEDLGVSSGMAELAFPRSAIEALQLHLQKEDQILEDALDKLDLPSMKIRDRITIAVRTRLEYASGHREAVKRAMSLLALPHNVSIGTSAIWATSDIIWHATGDTSTDHNWYTKRMTLSALYSAVLIFWLNDDSEGFCDTWGFLDRRIEDVMKIEKTKFDIKKTLEHMPSISRFLGRLRYPTP